MTVAAEERAHHEDRHHDQQGGEQHVVLPAVPARDRPAGEDEAGQCGGHPRERAPQPPEPADVEGHPADDVLRRDRPRIDPAQGVAGGLEGPVGEHMDDPVGVDRGRSGWAECHDLTHVDRPVERLVEDERPDAEVRAHRRGGDRVERAAGEAPADRRQDAEGDQNPDQRDEHRARRGLRWRGECPRPAEPGRSLAAVAGDHRVDECGRGSHISRLVLG